MKDLDTRLREILLNRSLGQYTADGDGNFVPVNWEDSPLIDEYIAEIKQCFAECDYVHKHDDLGDLLTGQEWFERFEREIEEISMEPPIVDGVYLEAAQRASYIIRRMSDGK